MPPLRVNIVLPEISSETILVGRIETYAKRADDFSLVCSEAPVPESDTDCYLVAADDIGLLTTPRNRPPTWRPVIAYGPPEHLRHAYAAGCTDYLKEPWTPEELHLRALQQRRARVHRFAWGTMELAGLSLLVRFDGGSQSKGRRDEPTGSTENASPAVLDLNRRQAAVIETLLSLRGQVATREVLFFAMWGRDGGTSRAVDMQVHELRSKLDTLREHFGEMLVKSVYGYGYIIE